MQGRHLIWLGKPLGTEYAVKKFLLGREPALLIGFLSAALSVLAALGLQGLGSGRVGLIVAAVNAVLGVAQAVYTRPIAPAAFTTLVAAAAALAAGYGYHASPELIGAINALVVAFLSLMTRQQVSPAMKVKAQQAQPAAT
jgi:hypothetical protein